MYYLTRRFFLLFLGFAIYVGSLTPAIAQIREVLSAEESDPKKLGWMEGFPPQPDKLIMQPESDYFAFGKITLLVNNVGGGGPKPFEMDMDTFIWAYELNVFSVFHLCQLCAPHMEAAGGGAILNISSMAGENKNKKMAAYGSSKAAESHLTRNIAFDLGPKGIRVNAIAPGAIKTDALATVLTPDIEKAMLKHTPLSRLGQPSDIAYAALFLCSPAASWVSGQVLTVSGGGAQELD
jgi:7-alpha-hydroxysteroid dehydrogenase